MRIIVHFMTIRDLPLFDNTDDDEYARLLSRVKPNSYKVARGETLLAQGVTYESLHALVSGSCYAEMLDSRGKVLRLESFRGPYLFAPAVLFATNNVMPGSVHASSDCQIVRFSREEVLSLCSQSKTVLENLLRITSDRFIFLSNRISFLSFRTIREKTMRYLEMLMPPGEEYVELDMPLEKLAEFFGVTRPALSRVLSELEENGSITREGKQIRLERKEDV